VLKVPSRPDDLEGVSAMGCPSFSPDGKYVALGWHRYVRVFEVATGQEVCSFAGVRAGARPVTFAPDGRTVASGEGTSILTWDVTGRAPDGRLQEMRLGRRALEMMWEDLSSEDGPRGHRAIWALVPGARQSLPFLRARLLARPAVADKQVRRWIAELDSEQFALRRKATDELEALGRFAEPALREALQGNPQLEPRRRIEQLLKRLASPANRLRAARVTQVLEQIGTPEARKVLEALAREPAEGLLARQAKSALGRISGGKE